MKFKEYRKDPIDDVMIYARVDDDNVIRLTCIADHQELKDWIAEGNTPEAADQTVYKLTNRT